MGEGVSANLRIFHKKKGWSHGSWTLAFLKLFLQVRATLFDLPHVVLLADRRIRSAGLLLVREKL